MNHHIRIQPDGLLCLHCGSYVDDTQATPEWQSAHSRCEEAPVLFPVEGS